GIGSGCTVADADDDDAALGVGETGCFFGERLQEVGDRAANGLEIQTWILQGCGDGAIVDDLAQGVLPVSHEFLLVLTFPNLSGYIKTQQNAVDVFRPDHG